ncbi:MAG: helix-turn-helix transcriptional regulator [Bacteroidetes bacterium]|nr:helix-turn-helix transcriptional regulator [Bacteroidota bacterium]
MLPAAIHAATNKSLILAILAKCEESYGYEIIQLVQSLSEGAIQWKDGMLYPVLHRMEKDRLVATRWEIAENGRKRKYYRITKNGHEALAELKLQWEQVNSTMNRAWQLKMRLASN